MCLHISESEREKERKRRERLSRSVEQQNDVRSVCSRAKERGRVS